MALTLFTLDQKNSCCTKANKYIQAYTLSRGNPAKGGREEGWIVMSKKYFLRGIMVALVSVIGCGGISLAEEASPSDTMISAEAAADFIHAVVEAHRTIYSTHIVERMQKQGKVVIEEDWEQNGGLPLPAQFLLYAGGLAAEKGGGVRLRLASLWPINQRNLPTTPFEKDGLLAVAINPEEPFSSVLSAGRRKIFKAIYADRAVSESCVNCHNSHALSPKKDFKVGEVMGAIIITFPIY
jgi:hypothetical protein